MSPETDAISKLKKLLESNCIIEKVQPPVMALDALSLGASAKYIAAAQIL